MEPTDLKNDSPESVQLETWLRSEAAATPLPDDGFSRRVLAALPARTPRLSRQRLWFCLGGALLGVIVTLVGLQRPGSLAVDLPALGPVFTQAVSQLATPAVGGALGLAVLSLGFAFRRELRPLVGL